MALSSNPRAGRLEIQKELMLQFKLSQLKAVRFQENFFTHGKVIFLLLFYSSLQLIR